MARVIKADKGGKAPAPRRSGGRVGGGKRRVLEKEVYKAKQEAEEIRARAEEEKERLLHEGKRQAAQLREEAQAEGAQEAFAQAAAEALVAFRRRAERYGEAADDVRMLALEVVNKIFGHKSRLSTDAVGAILEQGMNRLRARRRLRVQVPQARFNSLQRERPVLLAALGAEPDLLVEAADDVSPGRARVVTEVGGALMDEQTALDSLADALDVREQATAPRPRSALHPMDDFDEDDDDEHTAPHMSRPQRTAETERAPPARSRAAVGLGVAAPAAEVGGIGDIQVGGRAQMLEDAADPEATMTLDVGDLRDELAAADQDIDTGEEDDDLDLYADDSVPEH
jgi:flagellar biosynthesis/type III secretory pathway protein FliH